MENEPNALAGSQASIFRGAAQKEPNIFAINHSLYIYLFLVYIRCVYVKTHTRSVRSLFSILSIILTSISFYFTIVCRMPPNAAESSTLENESHISNIREYHSVENKWKLFSILFSGRTRQISCAKETNAKWLHACLSVDLLSFLSATNYTFSINNRDHTSIKILHAYANSARATQNV